VAVAQNKESGRYYAVQMFGRSKSQRFEFTISNDTKLEVTYEVDGREYSLPARVTRTHGECRPAKVTVHLDDERRESFTPKTDERIAITGKEGEFSVERRSGEQE